MARSAAPIQLFDEMGPAIHERRSRGVGSRIESLLRLKREVGNGITRHSTHLGNPELKCILLAELVLQPRDLSSGMALQSDLGGIASMALRLERLVGCQCSIWAVPRIIRAFPLLSLMGALFLSHSSHARSFFFSSDTAAEDVAAQLVEGITESKAVDEPCFLYLVDKEGAIGTLLVQESWVALQEALAGALNQALRAVDCRVELEESDPQTKVEELTTKLAAEGRAGSVMTLSLHRSVDGVMLFATTYDPNGRFGAFSGKVELPVQAIDKSQPAAAGLARQTPAIPRDHDDAASRRERFLQTLKERAGTERAE